MKVNKPVRLFFSLLLVVPLFPASPIFAETVQDVPVGEPTISSKAEDPLKEYKEKAQNQVKTVESSVVQDVSRVEKEVEPSPTKIEEDASESPTPENGGGEASADTPNTKRPTPRGGGGISPQTITLIEGDPEFDDPNTYHIDKDFAELLRTNASAQNQGTSWSGYGKLPNTLTSDDMENIRILDLTSKSLKSLKGINYALNLVELYCVNNQISELDLSENKQLLEAHCSYNKLTSIVADNHPTLFALDCRNNELSELDVSGSVNLKKLYGDNNRLQNVTIGINPNLETLQMVNNRLENLDITNATGLEYLNIGSNLFEEIDISKNLSLEYLLCYGNKIRSLNLLVNKNLLEIDCSSNVLRSLDLKENKKLKYVVCSDNLLTNLDTSKQTLLEGLFCSNNNLISLDLRYNTSLISLDASNTSWGTSKNGIKDITSLNGLTGLTQLNVSNQQITIPVPSVSPSNEATIDVLKTTAQTGLKQPIQNSITPPPTSILPNATNGDIIELTGVTRDSLSDKSIQFEYDSDALAEGASSYTTKLFSGTITFALESELKNELQVSSNKTKSGEELTWNWTITSLTPKKAEDIKATFTLPNYQAGDITDIQITHQPSGTTQTGTINHLNGTDSLGDLDQGESIEITFKSVARGDPDAWYEAVGRLDWSDNTPSSPHSNESKQRFKILDDEQQDLPKDSDDMGILSAPVRFYFGSQNIFSTIQTYQLNAQNYQTNTNVLTDGFYTRVKDDQIISIGWKLTASLSEFTDSVGRPMPNGAGTSLRLENMFIQKVNNRDTPQEALDPAATGGPSTVQTDETLVAGQTAKTLVSAQVGEGQGTWQLQMPFDDISLTLPAGAGKSNTDYKAKLTWSLQDTP